jgi:hypothetical protein
LLALSRLGRSLAAGFEVDEVLQDLAQQVTKVLGLAAQMILSRYSVKAEAPSVTPSWESPRAARRSTEPVSEDSWMNDDRVFIP